jgi:hypothetical protein
MAMSASKEELQKQLAEVRTIMWIWYGTAVILAVIIIVFGAANVVSAPVGSVYTGHQVVWIMFTVALQAATFGWVACKAHASIKKAGRIEKKLGLIASDPSDPAKSTT